MTTLRTAAQQALEALELHAKQYPHMQKGYTADAITTLRSALVEPEQDRALQWGAAPVRIELGSSPNGWREAFLPLGKDNTLRLLAETEALPLVENALRAALAQQAEPVQEPVGEAGLFTLAHLWAQQAYWKGLGRPCDIDGARGAFEQALKAYTAPPQRKPLTEDEIDVVLKKAREDVETGWPYSPSYVLLAIRGVERAHGIGEQDAQV